MNEIERVQVKTYSGTLESLREMIIDLKVKEHEYHFNALNGEITIIKNRDSVRYRIGDCYQIPLPPEKFEAIG